MKKTDDVQSALKTYHAPKLVVYGDIRAITQNVGNMGAVDGGSGNTSKTM